MSDHRHSGASRGIQPGGRGDPVADSIRRQQRADAAPSRAEIARTHEQHLREEGCHVDGCDETDPSQLTRQRPTQPNCPALQPAEAPPEVVCETHERPVADRLQAQAAEQARHHDVPVVLFDCGRWERATTPDLDDDGVLAAHGITPQPTVPAECECGACIDTVLYPDDLADADDG